MIIKQTVMNPYRTSSYVIPVCVKLRNRTITLFGGEPLLRENKDIVAYILQKGKEYGYTFTAISNGYDLDAYEDWLISLYVTGSTRIRSSRYTLPLFPETRISIQIVTMSLNNKNS